MSLDLTDPAICAKFAELERLEQAARKVTVTEAEQAMHRKRMDFRHFLPGVTRDEETNLPIVLAEHQLQWIDHINFCWGHGLHCIILSFWGSGKTALMEMVPLFVYGHDTTARIKIISSSDDLAKKRVGKIRDYVTTSENYKQLFPAVVPNEQGRGWTEHSFFLERETKARDPSLEAVSITAHATGGRADIIIVDDAQNEKNCIANPKDRDKVWMKYTTAFLTRLSPDGRVIFIATRWHIDDLFGHIVREEKMRERYGILVQRIYPECQNIESSFFYPKNLKPSHGRFDNLFKPFA